MRRPPARVRVLLARSAPIGIVFRRGPSHWTLVLRWDTSKDEVEVGDWFRGRIYENRCDLTPDGTHLVYFAAAYGGGLLGYHYGYAWTGVSEAPSLRPIAYWSKGDAWYGGGLFQDDRTLWINQPADERSLFAAKDDEAFRTTFDVTFNAEASGEDEPIFGMRRSRDGWQLLQEAVIEFTRPGFTTPVPEVREKKRERHTIRWTRSLEGYTKLNVFELVSEDATQTLPDAQWADWDHGGRLAFIREGRLYVVDADADVASPTEIADFNTFQPEDRVPDA